MRESPTNTIRSPRRSAISIALVTRSPEIDSRRSGGKREAGMSRVPKTPSRQPRGRAARSAPTPRAPGQRGLQDNRGPSSGMSFKAAEHLIDRHVCQHLDRAAVWRFDSVIRAVSRMARRGSRTRRWYLLHEGGIHWLWRRARRSTASEPDVRARCRNLAYVGPAPSGSGHNRDATGGGLLGYGTPMSCFTWLTSPGCAASQASSPADAEARSASMVAWLISCPKGGVSVRSARPSTLARIRSPSQG